MVQPSNDPGRTTTWTVVYEREGSDADSIDAQELASALSAMQQLCLRSNDIINGGTATVSLHVFALERGSIEVPVELTVAAAVGLQSFPTDFVVAAETLKSILIGNKIIPGVIGIYKLLKGRRRSINEINADTVNIIEGDVNINITTGERSVIQDVGVRGSLRTIIDPLQQGSFDRIVFRDDDGEIIELVHDDFDWPSVDEPPDEHSSFIDIPSQRLRLTSPNLENRNAKWRLNDGQHTQWYSINDENFWQRVISGEERFGTRDILICDVRIIQTVSDDNSIKNDYQIMRVIDRSTEGSQLRMDGI